MFYFLAASDVYHPSDDIQTISISGDNIQKVIEKLQNLDKDVQQTALDCIKTFCEQGIIFCNLINSDFHHF